MKDWTKIFGPSTQEECEEAFVHLINSLTEESLYRILSQELANSDKVNLSELWSKKG